MKKKVVEGIPLSGQFIMKAWKPRVLSVLLARGIPYRTARGKLARSLLVTEIAIPNLIVTVGKELLGDWMIQAATPGSLSFHAIGTDATTPSITDVALTAEAARIAFASRTRLGSIITLSAFYPAGDCTFNIQEVGIFGGSASSTPGSGTLLSHALLPYDNSLGAYDLTFDYNLTIG
jgi:hypothetical protein